MKQSSTGTDKKKTATKQTSDDSPLARCTECGQIYGSTKAMRSHRSKSHVSSDDECRVCGADADVIKRVNGASYTLCNDCKYKSSFDWKGLGWDSLIEDGVTPDELNTED